MSGEHSILAPSAGNRTVACPGSVQMAQQYPEEDGPEAMEGTAAHWVLLEWLTEGIIHVAGDIAPNGVTITDEMLGHVEVAAEFVMTQPIETSAWHVEERLVMPHIHELNWGTADWWAYFANSGVIKIADYKHGHRYVEVVENWQLINYVAGILYKLGIDGLQDQHLRIEMTIIQPRSFHRDGPIRTWSVLASDLRPHFNVLQSKYAEALGPNPSLRVNSECRDCPARRACPANQAEAMWGVDYAGTAVPFNLSPLELGTELKMVKHAIAMLEARESGLSEQAFSIIQKGGRVPFFGIEHGKGVRKWTKPISEVLTLGELYGVDLSKPREAITPVQATTLIDEAVIKEYSAVSKGAAQLIPINLRKVFPNA